MRVILLEDVAKLGRMGDIKNVSDGYARNMLLARGLAKTATPEVLNMLAAEEAGRKAALDAEIRQYKALAGKLDSVDLHFTLKLGEDGAAFGSVSASKIADELAKNGVVLKKEHIELPRSIKTLGLHEIPVNFPHGVKSKIRIAVEKEP